jgi:hypothetical protein
MADKYIDAIRSCRATTYSELISPRQIEAVTDQSQGERTRSADERKSFAHLRQRTAVADDVEPEIRVGPSDHEMPACRAPLRPDHQIPGFWAFSES